MTDNVDAVREAVRPAIERYLDRLAEHERYSATAEALTTCRCGWKPPYPARSKSANRSLGQHIRYAHRDAGRLWRIERDEALRRYYR